jgi:Zn-dependent metalloprotease
MSLNTKMEIWIEVLKTRVPDITFNEAVAVSAQAASDWYNGANTELAKLFEQFVILKTLKGIKNDPETE